MNRPAAPDQDRMESPRDEALLVRYLIGDCSDKERTQVEERFFADNETFDRLCELEEDLAARYARGELRADERAHFERAYSASPRRDRLILNLALGRVISSTPATSPQSPASHSSAWKRWLTFEPTAARWTLAAATIVLLIGSVAQFQQTNQLRTSLGQSQQDAAELRARLDEAERRAAESERRNATRDPAAPTASPVIATFVLRPGLTRNARGPARVAVPPTATALRLQLNLEFDGGYTSLKADLRTEAGRSVWTQDGLQPERTADGRAVVVTIPASTFVNGDYELLLQGVLKNASVEDAATYYFTIVR